MQDIMKTRTVLVWAAALLALPSTAAQYEELSGGILQVTVPLATTNTIDSGYVTKLNNDEFAKIVKKGYGGLDVDVSLSGFTGAIDVDEGTLIYRTSTSLGSLAAGSGTVTVASGATLCAWCTTVNALEPTGKRIVIAGDGYNGAGAIDCRTEQQKGPFGTNLVLAADARVRTKTQWFPAPDTRTAIYDLNGHTLKLYSEGSSPAIRNVRIMNPGDILVEKSMMTFDTSTVFEGGAEHKLSLGSSGSVKINLTPAKGAMWTLEGSSEASGTIYGAGKDSEYDKCPGASTNVGYYAGPVVLRNSQQRIMNAITRFGGLTFAGKVSGEGGLFIWGNAEWDGSKYKHPYLSLTNPENDFTMGVKCQYGGLRLWKDGALPTTAPVELDREGEVVFDELSVPFANLPKLNVTGERNTSHASFVLTNAVRFGRGRWSEIVKSGGEPLAYYSGVGADVFDVRKGMVMIAPEAKSAGLVGGCRWYANRAAATVPFEAGEVVTNGFFAGMNALYDISHEWWKVSSGCNLITYHGYIWNRTGADVTWSFAGGRGTRTKFSIDGVSLIDSTSTPGPAVCTVTLTPGAHEIDLRILKESASGYWNNSTYWKWESFEFGYDTQGRDSDVEAYYQMLKDPGDGSLLTVCRPEDDLVYPGYEADGAQSRQPDFGVIKFAAGTCVDFRGGSYAFNGVEGVPVVSNCTHFAVTGTWTVAMADVGVKVLETEGSADFSNARFTTDGAGPEEPGEYVLCRAEGGITGVPQYVKPSPSGREVRFRVADNGKSLVAEFMKRGSVLVIR